MLDLARVQKLHEAAILAGLPGVLPNTGYEQYAIQSGRDLVVFTGTSPITAGGGFIYGLAAQAAVAWWLREWCRTMRERPNFDGDHYLAWAEEIVANRKDQK